MADVVEERALGRQDAAERALHREERGTSLQAFAVLGMAREARVDGGLADHFLGHRAAAGDAARAQADHSGGVGIGGDHGLAGDVAGRAEVLGKRARDVRGELAGGHQRGEEGSGRERGQVGQRGGGWSGRSHRTDGIESTP